MHLPTTPIMGPLTVLAAMLTAFCITALPAPPHPSHAAAAAADNAGDQADGAVALLQAQSSVDDSSDGNSIIDDNANNKHDQPSALFERMKNMVRTNATHQSSHAGQHGSGQAQGSQNTHDHGDMVHAVDTAMDRKRTKAGFTLTEHKHGLGLGIAGGAAAGDDDHLLDEDESNITEAALHEADFKGPDQNVWEQRFTNSKCNEPHDCNLWGFSFCDFERELCFYYFKIKPDGDTNDPNNSKLAKLLADNLKRAKQKQQKLLEEKVKEAKEKLLLEELNKELQKANKADDINKTNIVANEENKNATGYFDPLLHRAQNRTKHHKDFAPLLDDEPQESKPEADPVEAVEKLLEVQANILKDDPQSAKEVPIPDPKAALVETAKKIADEAEAIQRDEDKAKVEKVLSIKEQFVQIKP